MRGATNKISGVRNICKISIHAPHAGSDHGRSRNSRWSAYFNPRSPCGERQTKLVVYVTFAKFQSTLPMRGATMDVPGTAGGQHISIHAPHAGSDSAAVFSAVPWPDFNPRSPCGERRYVSHMSVRHQRFQSTLPMRGATTLP